MRNMLSVLLAAGTFLCGTSALAISESNYDAELRTQVLPFYANGTHGHFLGRDNVTLDYRYWLAPGSEKAVVFLTGYGETYYKYHESLYEFYQAGYSVFTFDHRSQGFSQRVTKDPAVVYVNSFDEYVSDLEVFVDTLVNPLNPGKKYIVAHSMGGMIASLYTLKHPQVFAAQVFSSPMFAFLTNGIPDRLVYSAVAAAVRTGFGKKPAPSQASCKADALETDICTHSEARWKELQRQIAELPQLVGVKASNGWVKAGFEASRSVSERVYENHVPTLIFQAGDDHMVSLSAQDHFCKNSDYCEKSVFSGAFHEILQEKDFVRDSAMSQLLGFLRRF